MLGSVVQVGNLLAFATAGEALVIGEKMREDKEVVVTCTQTQGSF
jgi:hypothetical protein